jgi:hypothetical protein
MESKRCPRCKRSLPRADFFRQRPSKDGLSFYCKHCLSHDRAALKEWVSTLPNEQLTLLETLVRERQNAEAAGSEWEPVLATPASPNRGSLTQRLAELPDLLRLRPHTQAELAAHFRVHGVTIKRMVRALANAHPIRCRTIGRERVYELVGK